ncbi:MAG TPA: hypothetical protein VNT26_11285 [Candidatus Sulfotelmatobacter sp.]|nr:hypothetical protein [Candidatus Sulfotelmatobacter sp.]
MKTKLRTRTLTTHHLLALILLLDLPVLLAQNSPASPGAGQPPLIATPDKAAKAFDEVATKALAAMKTRAGELSIQGVAVIAYVEGDNVTAWSSKMTVVGTLKTAPSEKDPGANLLAIAYTKAAEMADTLKASGSGVRPPMKGEFGWQGGLVKKGKTGYLIAAFSGGKSEDDVKVSQAGLDVLDTAL